MAGLPTTWAAVRELSARRGRGGGVTVDGCGRGDSREDERSAHAGGLAELQRGLRHHQPPVGSRSHRRWLLRWVGSGAGVGIRPFVDRLGSRGFAAQSGAFLRCLRTQADIRAGGHPRDGAAPAAALPVEGDLAVCGPMARTAGDLTSLLEVMAGPDPLTLGVAYGLALPPARHQRLCDFRVLVLDRHPLIATGSAVRAGVNRVADALTAGGARVEGDSPPRSDRRRDAVCAVAVCQPRRAHPRPDL
ncbi:hypothetical protein ABIA39_005116 [Nocardia sp. GAS34]